MWEQAKALAAKTSADRNRYVDFLRAVSICMVIIGHWLVATIYILDGEFKGQQLLFIPGQEWTQWLTWIFQVMPIFFIVGGYANAVSLESSRRRGERYAEWLASRLVRLVTPLLVLVIGWAVLATVLRLFGVERDVIKLASQAALVPTWFLAIYIMVVILAPAAYSLWKKLGLASVGLFLAMAILTDVFFFKGITWPAWCNYFWVWLTVHQLGFAWRDGRLENPAVLLVASAIGFACLYLLIFNGPYPLWMVGSPADGASNTLPPKITLIALGIFQFGILLSLEKPGQRWLQKINPWASTVLINSMIMTIYLWHVTVLVILVGILALAGAPGLDVIPGSGSWWMSRPIWILVLTLALIPFALALSPLERRGRKKGERVPAAAQQVTGSILLCLGVSLLAFFGYGGGPKWLDVGACALILVGAGFSGLLPRFGSKSG